MGGKGGKELKLGNGMQLMSFFCLIKKYDQVSKYLKVRKSQKQYMVSSILPENDQKITILSIFSLENTLDSDFCFFEELRTP